jgi:hypothetical protein
MILLVFFFSKQKFSRQKILEKRAKKMISHSIFFIAKKLATTTSENKTNSFHQANPIGLYEIQQ